MTKQENIKYWNAQVESDFNASKVLCLAGYYAQSLFWAHLTLEKALKALWIKNSVGDMPPFVHNLLRIAKESNSNFSELEFEFFVEMNIFQIKGRYPDYVENIEEIITKEIANEYLLKTKNILSCIQEKLQ
jgi:HEPN domain-containing protein